MLSAELYNSVASLERAIRSVENDSSSWIVELDQRIMTEDIHSKIGLFRFNKSYFVAHAYRSRHWCVRGYNRLRDDGSMLYEQELIQAFIPTPDIVSAFDIAGVEYGRADIGIFANGISIYEIGTTPVIDVDLSRNALSLFPQMNFKKNFSDALSDFLHD